MVHDIATSEFTDRPRRQIERVRRHVHEVHVQPAGKSAASSRSRNLSPLPGPSSTIVVNPPVRRKMSALCASRRRDSARVMPAPRKTANRVEERRAKRIAEILRWQLAGRQRQVVADIGGELRSDAAVCGSRHRRRPPCHATSFARRNVA